MKERPILFSAPMVRALLNGSKTQTRRIVKTPPSWDCIVYADWGNGWWPYRSDDGESPSYDNNEIPLNCPYGQPRDRLWVRETFCAVDDREFAADGGQLWVDYRATPNDSAIAPAGWHNEEPSNRQLKWTPCIHMPRWASRINLEITEVRVERLQEISEADAIAEGVTIEASHMSGYCAGEFLPPAIRAYRDLWENINGPGSWDANPWVWAVSFKVIK